MHPESAGLTLHPQKTRVVDTRGKRAHFDFLGCHFRRSQRGRLVRLVSPQSEQKLKGSLKPLTKPTNGCSLEAILHRINSKPRVWFGFFKQANTFQLRDALRPRPGWIYPLNSIRA